MSKAISVAEGKRTDAYNHQKVVAESLGALSWVVYTGKDCGLSLPGPHVEESWQAAEFYNNKVLVEFKTKDANHVEWAKAVKDLYIPGLRDYVKKFHTTGPAWNQGGIDVSEYGSNDKKGTAGPKAPPPPPKVPPPPPTTSVAPPSVQTSAKAPAFSMSAVFQEINKGEGVTTGLRKVTDDMKTKNQADRTGAVPAGPVGTSASEKRSSPSPVSSSKAPKFELQMGRKWIVENHVGNKNLIIDDCNARQSVYIFGCKDSVVHVKGKVNNITVDTTTKTGIVFSDVVAAFELVNCTSVEVQCQGKAPTIAIDNTNGCQLYLSKDSLHASITTAKSSEINVLIPGATADADPVEHALPEQFVNVFQNGQFVTTPVSHSGGGLPLLDYASSSDTKLIPEGLKTRILKTSTQVL